MKSNKLTSVPYNLRNHDAIKIMLSKFKYVDKQDTNSYRLIPDTEIKHFIKELLINASVDQVSLMHLVESVGCHHDSSFVKQSDLRVRAMMIVLDIKQKRKYVDSLECASFYSKNNGFQDLCKWDILWFNAKQAHALMNNGALKLAVFWFNT